ncbi:hypothetical protein ABZP36_032063 [Zizania latifolia]
MLTVHAVLTVADWNYCQAGTRSITRRSAIKNLASFQPSPGRYDHHPSHPSPLLQEPNTKKREIETFLSPPSFQVQYGGRSLDPRRRKNLSGDGSSRLLGYLVFTEFSSVFYGFLILVL